VWLVFGTGCSIANLSRTIRKESVSNFMRHGIPNSCSGATGIIFDLHSSLAERHCSGIQNLTIRHYADVADFGKLERIKRRPTPAVLHCVECGICRCPKHQLYRIAVGGKPPDGRMFPLLLRRNVHIALILVALNISRKSDETDARAQMALVPNLALLTGPLFDILSKRIVCLG
jgi:hypothetical protein